MRSVGLCTAPAVSFLTQTRHSTPKLRMPVFPMLRKFRAYFA